MLGRGFLHTSNQDWVLVAHSRNLGSSLSLSSFAVRADVGKNDSAIQSEHAQNDTSRACSLQNHLTAWKSALSKSCLLCSVADQSTLAQLT
jgi:hypothetical protein